jgi:hypothetical protein
VRQISLWSLFSFFLSHVLRHVDLHDIFAVEATSEEDILDRLSLEGLQYFATANNNNASAVAVQSAVQSADIEGSTNSNIVDSMLTSQRPPTDNISIEKGKETNFLMPLFSLLFFFIQYSRYIHTSLIHKHSLRSVTN